MVKLFAIKLLWTRFKYALTSTKELIKMENKHFVGYLTSSTIESEKMKLVAPITQEAFDRLEGAYLHIMEYKHIDDLFRIFERNFEELLAYAKSFHSVSEDFSITEQVDEVKFNFNRLYLNLLSSFRSYLDHTEKYLKNIYGDNSLEFLDYKKLTGQLYDDNFEYRFIYKLRNYTLHCALPIPKIAYETYVDENNKLISVPITPFFERDILLNTFKKWGTVKTDLENQMEDMEVYPITENFLNCTYQLRSGLTNIIAGKLQEPAKLINDFISESSIKNFELCIFSSVDGYDINSKHAILQFGKYSD